MTIDLTSERDFHNQRFAEGDSRASMKKYYWAVDGFAKAFERRVIAMARSADVLELGCSNGDQLGQMAECKSYNGIDVSDIAVQNARSRTSDPKFKFHVMDAMRTEFPDQSFDLVVGVGVIHHLDIKMAAAEVNRLLRPGGRAIFWEPLALNPALGVYRLITPSARTKDEHPLLPRDFDTLRQTFTITETEFAGITSVAAVPFRSTGFGRALRGGLSLFDRALLAIPGVKFMAWFSIIVLQKAPAAS